MRKNFTTVELLVVIGLIALLAALLLPSLGKARGRAKGISCINNLRQLGMGFVLDWTDNDDYYCASKWGKAEGLPVFDNYYFYCFNPACISWDGLLTPDDITALGERHWKIWQCPEYPGDDAWEYVWHQGKRSRSNETAPYRRPKIGYQYNASAGYNSQVIAEYSLYGVESSWLRCTQVQQQSKFLLMLDRCNCAGNGGSWLAWYMINHDGACSIEEIKSQYCRHGNACNLVLADGHVTTASWQELSCLGNSEDGDTSKFIMQINGDGQD